MKDLRKSLNIKKVLITLKLSTSSLLLEHKKNGTITSNKAIIKQFSLL